MNDPNQYITGVKGGPRTLFNGDDDVDELKKDLPWLKKFREK